MLWDALGQGKSQELATSTRDWKIMTLEGLNLEADNWRKLGEQADAFRANLARAEEEIEARMCFQGCCTAEHPWEATSSAVLVLKHMVFDGIC